MMKLLYLLLLVVGTSLAVPCAEKLPMAQFDRSKYGGTWYMVKKIPEPNFLEEDGLDQQCYREAFCFSTKSINTASEHGNCSGRVTYTDCASVWKQTYYTDKNFPEMEHTVVATDYCNYAIVNGCYQDSASSGRVNVAFLMSRSNTAPYNCYDAQLRTHGYEPADFTVPKEDYTCTYFS